jgi:hypothetical protein
MDSEPGAGAEIRYAQLNSPSHRCGQAGPSLPLFWEMFWSCYLESGRRSTLKRLHYLGTVWVSCHEDAIDCTYPAGENGSEQRTTGTKCQALLLCFM